MGGHGCRALLLGAEYSPAASHATLVQSSHAPQCVGDLFVSFFFSVACLWKRHIQVRCGSVDQAENSVNEHLGVQTMNVEISDVMSYPFPSSCLCFIYSILFATSHFHFQALLS